MFLLALWLACSPSESAPEAVTPVHAPERSAAPVSEQVTVTVPRARALPPGTPNSGAFMTFHNGGTVEAKLVGAAADVSKTVELHTHVMEDGMMHMRQVPEILLPPGEDVVLEPGGLHVMLIGLTGTLEDGQRFPLTLEFSDGSSKVVEVPVQAIAVSKH
jgi:periplasmic copper chaperone A